MHTHTHRYVKITAEWTESGLITAKWDVQVCSGTSIQLQALKHQACFRVHFVNYLWNIL